MGKRIRSDVNPKHRFDGKTREQRTAAAIKAAATRKAKVSKARGDMVRFSLEIPRKLLQDYEDLVVTPGKYSSTSEAIRDGMRRLLSQRS
mgnify:CR=1 FL=1